MGTRAKSALVALLVLCGAAVTWRAAAPAARGGTRASTDATVRDVPAADPPVRAPVPGPPRAGADANALPVTVEGRVVAAGRPVRGAWVRARAADAEQEVHVDDADGRFVLGLRGEVEIVAAHPGHGPARRVVPAGPGVRRVEIELPAARYLDLLVLDDATGTPVSGASVLVVRAGSPARLDGTNAVFGRLFRGGTAPDPEASALLAACTADDFLGMIRFAEDRIVELPPVVTDGAGLARITGLPAGTVDAIVTHEGHAAGRVAAVAVDGQTCELRLRRGGGLTVLAPTGSIGLLCEVVVDGPVPFPVAAATIDETGRLVFPHVRQGRYLVRVARRSVTGDWRVPAGDDDSVLTSRDVEVADGQMTVLDLVTAFGTRVEGVFRGAEQVGDCPVQLYDEQDREVGNVVTDKAGHFRFDRLPPGRYRVTVLPNFWGGLVTRRFEVQAGAVRAEVVVDFPAGSIEGRVVGADGAPLAEAEVLAEPSRLPPGQLSTVGPLAVIGSLAGRVETDGDGRFVMKGLAEGEYRVLCAAGGRFVERAVRLAEDERARLEVRLDLADQPRLGVRCVDSDGKPVAAGVFVQGPQGGFAEMFALGQEPAPHERFEWRLPRGRYLVTATAPGFAPVLARPVALQDDADVVLELERGVTVTVDVRRGGRPVENVNVSLRDARGVLFTPATDLMHLINTARAWPTDAAGRATVKLVPRGSYRIEVDGAPAGTVEVADDAADETVAVK